jgi:ubiquinone/menaquinone biosynthesis C-methylase UbiE
MTDTAPWSRLKSEAYSLFGRNPKSNRLVPSIAELEPAHAVLDVGCGPGAAVRAAAGRVTRAVGIDRSEAMVEIARRRSRRLDNVEFETGGAEEIPFADGSFDRVWTIHAFHHWEDQERGVAEALRVLRPGGWFLVVESNTKGEHGLDEARARELAERLPTLGFANASYSKPRRHWVVSGVSREVGT